MNQITRRGGAWVPIVLLLLAIASFQAGASIAKTLFPVVGALGMFTLRTLLGTVILAITMQPWRVRIAPGSHWTLLFYGLSLGLMNLSFYLAISRIPLGIAVAVEFSGPLAVAVVASRRVLDLCWAALAVLGIVLLLPMAHPGGKVDPVGMVYALAAGGFWALYIIFGRKAGAGHGVQTVALGAIVSSILIAPIGLIAKGSALLSWSVLLPGLAVALLSTALPYSLEMIALTRLPARTYGILMSVDPALAALFGLVVLHERLSGVQWVAILFIIGASIGTTVSTQYKDPVPG